MKKEMIEYVILSKMIKTLIILFNEQKAKGE